MPYRIKTVADLIGVPRATLLAWERRYSVVTPERHNNGYRAYSEEDVAVLRAVKALVDRGLKVSEAVSQVKERPPIVPRGETSALDSLRRHLFDALLAYDRDRAIGLLQQTSMMSFEVQIERIYKPLLTDVGEAWCEGRATISQEHYATGFVRERLTAMLVALNAGPRGGGRVLCSGYSDDPHELPVMILAIYLALAGFRVMPIGVAVPVEALARAVRDSGIQLVCVSLTLPRSSAEVRVFEEKLLNYLPMDCTVALGGSGLPAEFTPNDRVRLPGSVDHLISLGRSLELRS